MVCTILLSSITEDNKQAFAVQGRKEEKRNAETFG
jgi:hypothetical protein